MKNSNKPDQSGKARLLFTGSTLSDALAFVGGAIVRNPAVPICENIKVCASEGLATLTGSDMRQTATTTIPCQVLGGGESVTVLMPFLLLSRLINSLEDGPVTIDVQDDLSALPSVFGTVLKSGKGTYQLAGENPIDYSTGKGFEGQKTMSFLIPAGSREAFTKAITKASLFTRNDDFSPSQTGVFVTSASGALHIVATDGVRLLEIPVAVQGELPDVSAIFPKRFISQLSKLHAVSKPDVSFSCILSDSAIQLTAGDYIIASRLIDERFPDYKNAIPKNPPFSAIVNKGYVSEALKRIMLVANQTTFQVRFTFSTGALAISAEDLDNSNEGNEELACEYEGDLFEIGFNAKNFLPLLNSIAGEQVRISFTAPNIAVILYGESDPSIHLIMPVMLNTYA